MPTPVHGTDVPDPLLESFILAPTVQTEPMDLQSLYGRSRPLEVDVGCGKGRFLIAKATANPEVSFLGIDRRLKRVQRVEKKLRQSGLSNVRLLLADAAYVIGRLLPPRSVSTFYIFFSDPWPKRRHHVRRLFAAELLDSLHAALSAGGSVHVATDHMDYFAGIRKLFSNDRRFEETAPYVTGEEEQTEFELTFLKLGQPVGRCSFRKADPAAPPSDDPRRQSP